MSFKQYIEEAILGAIVGAVAGSFLGVIILFAWGGVLSLIGTYDAETYPSNDLMMGVFVASAGASVRIATIKGP